MNKKEEKWRNEGAAYALRVAKEKGVEYLEQDLRRRGALGISVILPEKTVEELYDMLAKRIMNTMKTVAMWVLYAEHGWRSVRLQRFEKQMDEHSEDCMSYDRFGNNYVTLSDMAKTMQDTCGIHPDMETLETIERENKQAHGKFVSLEVVIEVLEETGHKDLAEALAKKIENA